MIFMGGGGGGIGMGGMGPLALLGLAVLLAFLLVIALRAAGEAIYEAFRRRREHRGRDAGKKRGRR